MQIGIESELTQLLEGYVQRAKSDDNSMVFVYGSAFRDEDESDLGIHDVHMNQGNPVDDQFGHDNGVFQDGALFSNFLMMNG